MATGKRQLEQKKLDKLRLDKWLWAARFFKTRKLASEAISGGKVHVNNVRVKPAKIVVSGDELQITKGADVFIVQIVGLNDKRRPASEARELYTESDESIHRREEARELRRMIGGNTPHSDKKPDKRQRRLIRQFKGH